MDENIVGFDPELPLLTGDCYSGGKHVWIQMFRNSYVMVVKCEHCLQDAVIYYDLEDVAEKLFGYKYGTDYHEEK